MERKKVSVLDLQQKKKDGLKITMLSIYDYPMALLADRAGLDTILVGDSLAMTVLGHENTVSVTMDEMIHHTKAVTRGVKYTFVVGDMPFMSTNTGERDAIINAGRFIKEGRADAVKVEGTGNVVPIVKAIHNAGIPVVAHIGLTPQTVSMLGGLKVQGKDSKTAQKIIDDAYALQDTGAFAIILECVPTEISRIVAQNLEIPVISYGAGVHCDGQGMVSYDLLGLFDRRIPKFSRKYINLSESVFQAFSSYRIDVTNGAYPNDQESYHVDNPEVLKTLRAKL